jgi:hypothetical protein
MFSPINLYKGTLGSLNASCYHKDQCVKIWKDREVSLPQKVGSIAFHAAAVAGKALSFLAYAIVESLLFLPRYYPEKRRVFNQIQGDINSIPGQRLGPVFKKIEKLAKDVDLPEASKETHLHEAVATYITSQAYYAPVVKKWALSLLRKALQEDRQLVFLARDGHAPYFVAQELQKLHPELAGVKLHYKYLSRKVVNHATNPSIDSNLEERKAQLREYFFSDGLTPDAKMLFVDVGFMGSMIDTLKSEFFPIQPPVEKTLEANQAYRADLKAYYKKITGKDAKNLSNTEMKQILLRDQYKFNFLISHTPKADGFMGNIQHELRSVRSAGQNRAVHWLEDTHQGVISSPKQLVRLEDGSVVPDVLVDPKNPKTRKKEAPDEYLIKSAATLAIKDYVQGKVTADAYKEEVALEKRRFYAELHAQNILTTSHKDVTTIVKLLSLLKTKKISEFSPVQLEAVIYLLEDSGERLSKKISSLEDGIVYHKAFTSLQRLLNKFVRELSKRDTTNYSPGVMASKKTQEIFDQFLSNYRFDGRGLLVEHR